MIRLSEPQISAAELAAAEKVLSSGQLVQSRSTLEFEGKLRAYTGAKHAVAVSNGTSALYLSLLACGITGGEVITTPFTFVATHNAILWAGAKPVCVDVEEDTLNIDVGQIERAITSKTRAIMPVHLYGHVCNIGVICDIAEYHSLVVIEDACQAIGARRYGQHAGTFGNVGCFSFYATKAMTTGGEGGAVVTDDDGIAERVRLMRQHGMSKRYQYDCIGYNMRMTDMQAAIGCVQLDRLDGFLLSRWNNASILNSQLRGVTLPELHFGHGLSQYTIMSDKRDTIMAELVRNSIESIIFYPELLGDYNCPNAAAATRIVLSLPIHPGLSCDDVEKVAEIVNRCA